PAQQLELITEVFDTPKTLDRLCKVSGGHLRNLLGLMFGCLRQMDPPISRDCLEDVIRESRDYLTSSIDDEEWELLFQVVQQQRVKGDAEYTTLLRGMFVYEYRDRNGNWFAINPALEETQKFQTWLRYNNQ
ncbi:MAG TPA: KAP family P-loop domain-containing protein, partial [Cyanobacteria bacterium UBA11148]|nr:KAP family P-loop domain-containing protein [Cyanobacteria bacterium UBA11148]